MGWESTAPAAITALLTLFDGAAEAVVDGPEVTAAARSEALMVGWHDDDLGIEAVESTDTPTDYDYAGMRESYVVNSAIKVRDGNARNRSAARSRAFAVLAECRDRLANDPTLGGSVNTATPGPWSFSLIQMQKGVEARVIFPVQIDAFTE